MRICALLSLGALAAILALSVADCWNLQVIQSPIWFVFLALLLAPYVAVIWLLQVERTNAGLLFAAGWGAFASSLPLLAAIVPSHPAYATLPSASFLLFTVLGVPVQILMAKWASDALPVELKAASACLIAFSCGGCLCYFGLNNLPRHYGIAPAEVYATATMRSILAAESEYANAHGNEFSSTLRALCPLDGLDPVCKQLSEGTPISFARIGYIFIYAPRRPRGFALHADPLRRGETGQRSFFVDETGVIRANANQQAGPSDSPI